MGRIKTKLVKRMSNELISAHSDEFSTDFDENKEKAESFMEFPSKKIRNIIVGYVTRLKKKETA